MPDYPRNPENISEIAIPDWLTTTQRNKDAPFPIKLWSVHNRIVNDLPRTNNSVESWHNSFQAMMKKHPKCYFFIDQLRSEQLTTEHRVLNMQTGRKKGRQTAYVLQDQRLKEMLCSYKGDFKDFYSKVCMILKIK